MGVAGFRGFGWIVCGVIVSPGLYLVSSGVAAERGRLEAVDRAIVGAQRDLRGLETEFGTRANFAQLERWNGDVLALSSPRPDQYAGSEMALAALNPLRGDGEAGQTATSVMPSAPAPVVQVAAADATPVPATLDQAPAVATAATSVRSAVASGKAQAVAMLDRKLIERRLLDDGTMGDLMSGARAEAVRLR